MKWKPGKNGGNTAAYREYEEKNAGCPWTAEQEADLATLYSEGRSAKEIAATLERAPGGVRARLKKRGLISQ